MLSQRFVISLMLLRSLLDLMFLMLVEPACHDRAVCGACSTIAIEKQAHIMFTSERLTLLYADFNFIRRNVRRLRLRIMWGALLLHSVYRHGRLIRAAGSTRWRFVITGFKRFARLLEQMAPYRREMLLAALRHQRQDPYGKPSL